MTLSKKAILEGLQRKDRLVLSKTMTLFESTRDIDRALSYEVLEELEIPKKTSRVIGITGTPGVGKSTFLNTFGKSLLAQKKTLAILSIDPSSGKTGGSILGDKTRMEDLSGDDGAFIRPSPSGKVLGGVTVSTAKLIKLCEYFGFDYIFIESVGVGQSEFQLGTMVDYLLFLVAPGGGDDLQGIKKGVLEYTDLIVINKSDGAYKKIAPQTARLYGESHKNEPLQVSSLEGKGFDQLAENIKEFYDSIDLGALRRSKKKDFFWDQLRLSFIEELYSFQKTKKGKELEAQYLSGRVKMEESFKELLCFVQAQR